MNKNYLFLLVTACLWISCGEKQMDTDAAKSSTPETTTQSTQETTVAAPSTVLDFQVKTTENDAERTQILNEIRADLQKQKYPEFTFVVNHLKAKDNFAFFMGDAKNKDGSNYQSKNEYEDCCHVEALLSKEKGTWKVVVAQAFSTDAWYVCLWKEKKAPKDIFTFTEGCE